MGRAMWRVDSLFFFIFVTSQRRYIEVDPLTDLHAIHSTPKAAYSFIYVPIAFIIDLTYPVFLSHIPSVPRAEDIPRQVVIVIMGSYRRWVSHNRLV